MDNHPFLILIMCNIRPYISLSPKASITNLPLKNNIFSLYLFSLSTPLFSPELT